MLTLEQMIEAMYNESRGRGGRCVEKTTRGKPCRNRATFGGMCTFHFKRAQSSLQLALKSHRRSRLKKVERTVKLAGGIAGLIAATIKIVQFVVGHWDQITIGLDSPAHDRRAHGISQKFKQQCNRMKTASNVTDDELREFALAFENWFSNLSHYTQEEIENVFGKANLNELRTTFLTVAKT